MIQFNLLPDVKLTFLKAQRTKRLVMTISVIASGAAFTIFLLLFLSVNVVQKKNLSDLNKDIASNTSELKATKDLDKILTVQNQLNSLSGLHDQKMIASRLYDYFAKVTPSAVTISNTGVDFAANTMSISGNGTSLDAVNQYVDTLKFTTFTTDKNDTSTKAFSDVVLASFSRSIEGASYSITLTFDPAIFNATNKVDLKVPSTVTTRSVTQQPLFKAQNGGVQ